MVAGADLIIRNARVRTMDPKGSIAQAIAVWKGLVLAVGTESEIESLCAPETRKLDLEGRTVLPGFIDAHEHLSWFAEEPLKLDCSPQRFSSLAGLLAQVRLEASRLAPGDWIRGVLYDDTKMAEGRPLTRADLDSAAPEHPVIIIHVSAHWAVVNSVALKLGDLNEQSPDPKGGALGREPGSGRLDGRLVEMAMFNFAFESLAVAPTVVPSFPPEVRRKALQDAARTLNAAGVCGVGDALTAPSYIATYRDLAADGQLSLRVNMIIPYIFLPLLEQIGLLGPWGNEWIRCAGIKVIIDGAIAGRTAALKHGYADAPNDHGVLLIEDQAELDAIVARIHRAGYQACVHANGDLAIEMALTAIERAQAAHPRRDPRHRLEHCTMIDDALLAWMARLGAMALPFGSYLYQHGEKLERFYGARAARMFAHNSFLKAGVKVAGSSDHPAGLYPPLLGVQSMVTRRTASGQVIGPAERIPLEEAFRMYTVYAAHVSGEEHLKGQLSPGFLADLVVLDQDPWETPPEEISRIGVRLTMVGGRIVHGQA
ncbi:MAG TPA: amidohydrolase [Desulfobacterales bacterium]|nr:amidohydrolase [Desulfobacterales bacterium]